MKVALTKDYIESAVFATNTEVFDEGLAGFGIRIGPKRRTFFSIYWKDGRKHRANLGRFPGVSLQEARKAAKKISGNDLDPAGERRLQKEAGSFERVARLFIAAGFPRSEKEADAPLVRARTAKAYKRQLEAMIAAFGSRPFNGLTKLDLEGYFAPLGERVPIEANRQRGTLSRLYAWAVERGLAKDNLAKLISSRPGGKERRAPRKWLPAELAAVVKAIDADPDFVTRAFFTLTLLTGARQGDLFGARFDRVDFENGTLFVPAAEAKGRRDRDLVLSRAALAIVETLRAIASNEFLFPGNGPEGHRTTITKANRRIAKRAGVEFTVHEVRDAIAEFAVREAGTAVAASILGHRVTSGALSHYTSGEDEEKVRRVMECWSARLEALRTGAPAKVTAIA